MLLAFCFFVLPISREGAKTTHKDSSDEKHRGRQQRKSRERKSEEKNQSDVKQPSGGHHHHKSKSSKKRRRSKERESRSESESRHKRKKHKSKEKHRECSKDMTKEHEQDLKNNAVAEVKSNEKKPDDAKYSDTVEGTDKLQPRSNDI